MGEKIQFKNGKLQVPPNPIIPFVEGDGIGRDIWPQAQKVLNQAIEKAYNGKKKITWLEVFAGQKAFDLYNEWLPEKTLNAFKEYLVSIKGPLTTPVGEGFSSLNVAIRQALDLYVCLRPIRYFQGVPSPVKNPEDVNIIVFRENTEDIYAGIEFKKGSQDIKTLLNYLKQDFPSHFKKIRFPNSSSLALKPVSQEGTNRLVRAAIQYALDHQIHSLALVHKGNIMKSTEGGFRNWGYDLAEREFKDSVYTWQRWEKTKEAKGEKAANQEQKKALSQNQLIIKDVIADICLQQVLTRPKEFGVIATLNLNGDYLSDALAAQVGGIGIAPGGNINYETGKAVFEATHGTAPKYQGLDKVNPTSLILSGEMMLRYLGWNKASTILIKAINQVISNKIVTYDFARLMRKENIKNVKEVKCSEFANEVIKSL